MIRQLINISNFPYVVDLYDAYVDDIYHYEQFVMFRNYEVFNDVFMDKDLYFVEKSIWENRDNPDYEDLIWPINEKNGGGFSTMFTDYNEFFSEYGLNNGFDVNQLYNRFRNIANVRCNKVRIYRPSVRTTNNSIIHIDNFINNIHVHYLCKKFNDCEIHSEDEIIINNVVYSEYIEFYFPNVYDLFDNDKLHNHVGCYFKETLNRLDYSNIRTEYLYVDEDDNNLIYFPLDTFSLPYLIETVEKRIDEPDNYSGNDIEHTTEPPGFELVTRKKYVNISKSIENNYLTYPVNIIIWPYESNILNNRYVRDLSYDIGTGTFINDLSFTLSARMGFVDNRVSIISKFIYPQSSEFFNDVDDYGNIINSGVKKAYLKYNNVKESSYENISIPVIEKYRKQLELTTINEDDIAEIIDYYIKEFNIDVSGESENELKERYIDMKMNFLVDELNEDEPTEFDFIGFRVIIASDINFTHIIYDNNMKIDFKDLDDFAFNLNDVFDSWANVYDGYYMGRVMFIDRMLGVEIMSNPVMIGPEWIKFMVKSSNERIINFDNINTTNDEMFNCIENIRCIVKKTGDENSVTINRGTHTPRLLYKPIFYKASNLQNVRIRRNFTQNIGINLAEYLTKVDTFKMLFNGNEYVEYGRNDQFVIFNISGNNLTANSGLYDILNQDDEYIATGNYTVI